jgi:hypothetical protein
VLGRGPSRRADALQARLVDVVQDDLGEPEPSARCNRAPYTSGTRNPAADDRELHAIALDRRRRQRRRLSSGRRVGDDVVERSGPHTDHAAHRELGRVGQQHDASRWRS